MITLLPFENSVKLGVTNDYELGAGGGRTIKDYILGKYSSDQGGNTDLEGVFGRKSGCTVVLLKFQHNKHTQRSLCLGRIWWYANYKVSDNQLGFLSFDPISIGNLCVDSKLPKSPKDFKNRVKNLAEDIQYFETQQSYFAALSSALGSVNRNDLKLLNRAFYVKSISQIDNFIKDNMLLSVDNPHLDRLLENVKNGQEIASAIENCEKKLASIDRILKELERFSKLEQKIKHIQQEQSLLELLPDYLEIEAYKEQIKNDQQKILEFETEKPHLERQLEALSLDISTLQSQISKSDVAAQITLLERQIQHCSEKIAWNQSLLKKWGTRLKKINTPLPTTPKSQAQFIKKLEAYRTTIHTEVDRFKLSARGQATTLF